MAQDINNNRFCVLDAPNNLFELEPIPTQREIAKNPFKGKLDTLKSKSKTNKHMINKADNHTGADNRISADNHISNKTNCDRIFEAANKCMENKTIKQ